MKESRLEQEKCKNRGKSGVCEISQPLRNRHFAAKPFRSPNKFAAESPLCCGIAILLQNHFAASGPSLRNHFWHTSAISQHSDPHFATAKSQSIKTPTFRSQSPIPQGVSQLRNHPLAHECHLEAPYTHFAAAK